MKKSIIIFLIVIVVSAVIVSVFLTKGREEETVQEEETKELIRQPVVAGQFYPGEAKELEEVIDGLLENAVAPEVKGEITALIVPHAGYLFSGQTAAYGFKQLEGEQIDTVILIGPSHYQRFEGISVFPKGYYQTPLGEIEVDSSLAKKIIDEDERIFFKESAHKKEHSLEVEMPFLQIVLEDFKIVPIIFGNSSKQDYKILSKAILNNIKGKNILLVASSDFSHYPVFEEANRVDAETIEAILTGEVEKLEKTIQEIEGERIANLVTCACGEEAIKTVMMIAKDLRAGEIKLLNYSNSGDIADIGDKTRVVGYGAIGFFAEHRGNLLNRTEQEKLLEIAKVSVEAFVSQGEIPEFEIENEMLEQKLGAFVTLKREDQLRGCIGRFSPTDIPLYQVVSQMASAAASQDKRFLPVTEDELDDLEYEISVLSNLEKVDSWEEIEIGKHGVQIKQFLNRGVFLPQVAVDNNWDLEKFMGELCYQKAGLSRDCWKNEKTEIYVFTAQVF